MRVFTLTAMFNVRKMFTECITFTRMPPPKQLISGLGLGLQIRPRFKRSSFEKSVKLSSGLQVIQRLVSFQIEKKGSRRQTEQKGSEALITIQYFFL